MRGPDGPHPAKGVGRPFGPRRSSSYGVSDSCKVFLFLWYYTEEMIEYEKFKLLYSK